MINKKTDSDLIRAIRATNASREAITRINEQREVPQGDFITRVDSTDITKPQVNSDTPILAGVEGLEDIPTPGTNSPELDEMVDDEDNLGHLYQCPDCGKYIVQQDEIEGTINCPACGQPITPVYVGDAEGFSVFDLDEGDTLLMYEENGDANTYVVEDISDDDIVTLASEDGDESKDLTISLDDLDAKLKSGNIEIFQLNEGYRRAIKDGKVVRIKIRTSKRTKGGKIRRFTSKQRAALAKARRKSHTGSASKRRAKSMKIRRKLIKEGYNVIDETDDFIQVMATSSQAGGARKLVDNILNEGFDAVDVDRVMSSGNTIYTIHING